MEQDSHALEIFFSYAHEDERLRRKLEEHLDSLRANDVITAWHDRKIRAGERWEDLVHTHLEAAGIILLLISPAFFSSKYCFEMEMKRALERHAAGDAIVIPVLLRPCPWERAPLAALQIVPRNGRAISEWRIPDQAFKELDDSITEAVDHITGRTRPRPVSEPARKAVTVLSCRLELLPLGDGPLDVEARRGISRAFALDALLRAIVDRHGGTVDDRAAGALRAWFGIPRLHEDDARRAVRAAEEIRRTLAARNEELARVWNVRVVARIGIDTGEILHDPASGEAPHGEPVDVAEMLQREAAADELLIGYETQFLVRKWVTSVSREVFAPWRGTEPLPAYEVLGLRSRPERQPGELPTIGRASERALIEAAFLRVVSDKRCHLLNVLGEPGLGKWRLVEQVVTSFSNLATVLVTHCEPYREAAFDPVVGIVKHVAGFVEGGDPDAMRATLDDLLRDEHDAEAIRERTLEVCGVMGQMPGPETVFWVVSKLIEALARQRPVVAVFDDLHWAEPKLLDLIEQLASRSRRVPLLVACLARPELLDQRPNWGAAKVDTTSVWLRRLGAPECDRLIDELLTGLELELDDDVRAEILERAEGNPLFVKEMLSMVAEEGRLEDVPPTVEALLAARIDHLPAAERRVVRRAAIAGHVFSRSALAALVREDGHDVDAALATLMLRDLVQPERPALPGENVYRFTHRLVRDAAYDAMPKSLRAKLHERYARWLDHEAAEAQRDDEAIGYHLEQAIRYLRELGPADDHVRELAALAAARLGAAGRRALASGDVAAATHLLERAAGLLADGEPEAAALLTDLAHALRATGDFQRATTVLETAIDAASAAGDRRRALLAEIERASLLDYAEPTKETFAELRAVAQRAIDAFTAAGDEHGLARAYCLLSEVHWAHCRFGAMEEELGRALVHSERAGEERERSWILESLARAAFLGPTPVEAAMARCRQIVEVGGADPKVKAVAVAMIGGLHGMNDEREEAREHFTESRRIGEEFNLREWRAAMPLYAGLVELLAGDGEAAEAEFRLGYSASDQIGDRSRRANHAAFLAEALYLQGRHEEAKDAAGEAAQESPPDDVFSQAVWHGVLGKISAHAGDAERAEHLGLEAVAIARETDCLALQGHALLDLVEALTMTGRSQDAAAAAEEALDCFRKKGDVVSTRRAEQMRAAAGLTAAARKQYGPPVRRRGDADGSAA